MGKGITGVLLALALTIGAGSRAQYDRDYFYYVGRSFMIDNNFEDAIRTLNILLRFDDDAYEGYFLRGIAKYNLDDLLGAEADFTTAIEKNPVFTAPSPARGWATTTTRSPTSPKRSSCAPTCPTPITAGASRGC